MKQLLVLLALLVSWPTWAQATVDWDDDFEYADDTALGAVWAYSCLGNPGVSTTRPYTGTKSLKLVYNGHVGVDPGAGGCFIDRPLLGKSNTIYSRYYMYMENFTVDATQTKMVLQGEGCCYPSFWWGMGNSNPLNLLSVGVQGIIRNDGIQDTQVVFAGFGGLVPQNQWVCIETRLTMSSPGVDDGIVQAWINDLQVINKTTQRMRAATLNQNNSPTAQFQFVRHYTQHGRGTIYYDRHAESRDARIGCLGAPPRSDTTAPGPVTNLATSAAGATSAQLSWTLPTDSGGSGLKETALRRCTGAACTASIALTNVASPTAAYLDTTLSASTTYGYSAAGNDNAANIGVFSATVYVTTPAAGGGGSSAITFDAVTNSVANNNSAALAAFSHTTGAGANRLLTVCTQSRSTTSANVPVSTLTYGGTGLTFSRGDTRTDGTDYFRTELWYLIAPTSGAGNVAVTFTGALTGGYGAATAVSYAGVHQTTPIDASTGATGSSAGLAATITTVTDQAWIQDCAIGRADAAGGFVSVGAGQVSRTNRLTTTGIVDDLGVSTVNGKSPAGAEVMDWTQSNAQDWVLTTIALKPASGTVTAITFDAVSNSAANNSTISATWTHVVGSGSNRALAVCTQYRTQTSTNQAVSSVTYGSQALTKIRADATDDAVDYFRSELWYLIAPTVGSASVTVTWAGAPSASSYSVGSAASFFGVDQTNPLDAQNGSGGSGTALAATVTTVAANAWLIDCALGRAEGASGFSAVGAGQTSRTDRLTTTVNIDAVGMSTVNGKATPGAEVMDWTQALAQRWTLSAASFKPYVATVPPVIDSFTRTATTATVGYGTGSTTLPTSIRIFEGNNLNTSTKSTIYTRAVPPFDTVTATTAVITVALLPGSDFACAYAIDAAGTENQVSTDYKCVSTSGLVPIDTAGPVLSAMKANSNTTQPQLPNGATSFTLSWTVDKTSACLWDTVTHATYALFPVVNTMTTINNNVAATISSGVPAYPATQQFFGMCQYTDVLNATHDSAVISMTVSAAAPAGDTTAPTAATSVIAVATGQSQATVTWLAGTDAVGVTGHIVACSFGAGNVTYSPCANETTLTSALVNLPQNTVVNIVVYERDAAGNISLASNVSTVTTTALPDLNPPSNMVNLILVGTFTGSVILSWNAGSDAEGPVTATIEQCSQVAAPTECTDFTTKQALIAQSAVSLNLAPTTSYCWRGFFTDQAANRSAALSNVVCGMTRTTGLSIPRTSVSFSQPRTVRQ